MAPNPLSKAPIAWIFPLLTKCFSLSSIRKTSKKVKKMHFKDFEEFAWSVASFFSVRRVG
jgi:hypothetical protein